MNRLFLDELIDDPNPCPDIIKKGARYYKEPLPRLELKQPLEQLYEEAETDVPIGHWVAENVPRPGDLAACLPPPKPKRKGRAI